MTIILFYIYYPQPTLIFCYEFTKLVPTQIICKYYYIYVFPVYSET